MPNLRTVLVSCVISAVIIGGGVAVFYLTSPKTSPAETPANIPAPKLPRLWPDERSVAVAGAFTKDQVWVYAWENGLPDGWVNFEGENGPKKTPIAIPQSWITSHVEPHTKGRTIEPSEYAGFVLISLGELQNPPPAVDGIEWHSLTVVAAITWTSPDQARSEFTTYEWRDRIKCHRKAPAQESLEKENVQARAPVLYSSSMSDSSVQLRIGTSEGPSFFELKIIDPAAMPQRQ